MAKNPIGLLSTKNNLDDLMSAALLCHKAKLYVAGLMLTYSLIDILGAIGFRRDQYRSDRESFLWWCDHYLIPVLRPEIPELRSIDLYAARCGAVHGYSTDSDLARNNAAKQIGYVFQKEHRLRLIHDLNTLPGGRPRQDNLARIPADHVVVDFVTFYEAFRSGTKAFFHEVEADADWVALVIRHGARQFSSIEIEKVD
jgi:hypothetical protein